MFNLLKVSKITYEVFIHQFEAEKSYNQIIKTWGFVITPNNIKLIIIYDDKIADATSIVSL